MIVQVVQETDTCKDCPNMNEEHIRGKKYRYICNAQKKILGSDYDLKTVMTITTKIDSSCPFEEDEVNQRPRRGRVR